MMSASNFGVNKMNFLFKLLLFQLFVAWCGAKHVAYEAPPGGGLRVQFGGSEPAGDIQDSIRNFIHSGLYSTHNLDPEQVEMTVPVKVSREGALLSRAVEHAHDEHARTRRSADEREQTGEHEHTLHYNVTVAGRDLRLDLRPSFSFVTPSLIVERHTSTGRTRSPPRLDAGRCHYRGSVRGQPTSSIALSACDGLAGLLRTEHGEYWIEPSNHIPTKNDQGRPHLIYRRSAVSKENKHKHKRAIEQQRQKPEERRRIHNKDYLNKRRKNGQQKKNLNNHTRQSYEKSQHIQSTVQKKNSFEHSRSDEKRRNSIEHSGLIEDPSHEIRKLVRNGTYTLREQDLHNMNKRRNTKAQEPRGRRKHKRRRKRRRKNCATKEPPRSTSLQWTEGDGDYEVQRRQSSASQRRNKARRVPHQHALSHRPEFEGRRRSARSVSRPHHVEVLLVADRTMVDFHKDDIETYLLTIMNMVSSLYLDHTIGNFINVVVVKIILVEHLSGDLSVSSDSDATLASFCRWQQHLNPSDDAHRHHHDVAILITRTDLCSKLDTPCSTLGVAHVAGMCQPDRSCSVNEDNGLSLAHTITHELGHNFGLYHDTEKIGCLRKVGSTLHIMTPVFEADTVEVAWSRCSRRDVTNFLDAGMAECLGDQPSNSTGLSYSYPQLPAGAMYDAQSQCRMQFGAEVNEVCTDVNEICKHLWCSGGDGTCKTNLRPAAPGTTCGQDMWCQNHECVPRSAPPPPQDGGWGAWSAWSECSRTCGAGVSMQRRLCVDPTPAHGGKFCTGERTRYRICNTDPCPKSEASFRHVQCSKYDNTKFDNVTVPKWVPYFDQDEPCELYCATPNQSTILPFGEFAADGTPCNIGTSDMCISGICRRVGCDWVVDSNATLDRCGVCRGDGAGCKVVQGIYSKGTTKESGYSEVAVIPAGSRNVKIEEIANSKNYIGIGSARSRKFYLNGRRKINLAGEYLVAGSPAIYERDRDSEKVRIPGPIKEDIKIYQMIYRGKDRNPGVTYQYTIDRKPKKEARFWWRISGWTPCSRSCGGGVTRQIIDCSDDRNMAVDQEYCISELELQRPPELAQHCNAAPCSRLPPPTRPPPPPSTRPPPPPPTRPPPPPPTQPPPPATHWWVGSWSDCSQTCYRMGQKPVKRRGVYCVERISNRSLPQAQCDYRTKPIDQLHCIDIPLCDARY